VRCVLNTVVDVIVLEQLESEHVAAPARPASAASTVSRGGMPAAAPRGKSLMVR
jgi:hypothetical protein